MSEKVYLELSDSKSSKFWEIVLSGADTTVRFGKIGASGQSSTKSHGTAAKARTFFDKQIAAKKKKGYSEADGGDDGDEDEDDEDDDDEDDVGQPAKRAKTAKPIKVAVAPLRCSLSTPQTAFGIFGDGELVLVGDESGLVVECSIKKHVVSVKRKVQLPTGVKAVTKDGGFVYAGTNDGELYDLTHEPRLIAKVENFSQIFWLDVFEGAVACSSQNGDVALVNGEGEIVWHVKSSQWGAGSPCSAWMCRIDANGVYVGHSEGVAKYDFKGKRVWKNTDCCGIMFGTQTKDYLFVTGSGKSTKIDKKSGKTLCTYNTSGPSCTASEDGSIFVCCSEIFDGNSGEQLHNFAASWNMRGMSAAIAGDDLLVVSNGLNVFDISKDGLSKGGGPVKNVTLGKTKAVAVSNTCEAIDEADADGVIVCCVKEGSKVRVRVESPGYDSSMNVQFPRALREDGARFVVDSVVASNAGNFYRAVGQPKRLN